MAENSEKGPRNERWLNSRELERLTDAWQIWTRQFSTPVRAIGRARLHLFFLLARYAGMRSSEIASFPEQARLDRETGLLQLKDRKLFLPPAAMRPLRSILSLPEAENRDFLRLDAGFLRRTFYEVGKLANLRPEACAPRALRYARALELLRMRMPMQTAAAYLGISNPLRLARLMEHAESCAKAINSFNVILAGMETGYHAGRLLLRASEGLSLVAILSLEELADIEPAIGKPLVASVSPGLIFPSQIPLPMENRLCCRLVSLTRDGIENRLRLQTKSGLELLAMSSSGGQDEAYRHGMDLHAHIPARAIKIAADY